MTALEARGVSWDVAGRRIVDDVSLRTVDGGVLGVLGPNGSGKSTLLRLLAGHQRPSTGEVLLGGRPLAAWSRREVAHQVAVVEQQSATEEDLVVRDVIDLGRIPHRARWAGASADDRAAVEVAARRVGVEDMLDRRWRTLSGGEQQRVQLARALAQDTPLLLLDEPTNHLDIRAQLEILALTRAAPVTAVVAPAALSTVGVTAGPAAVVTSTPSVPAAPVAPTVRAVVGPVLFRFAQGVSPTAACGLALEGTARGGARLVC